MLIDYLANRKLLNNNVAGKSIKKEHFLAGNVRLWGKRKHHFRLIDNPLFCVSLFCPNPRSFDMRDKKKMLDCFPAGYYWLGSELSFLDLFFIL